MLCGTLFFSSDTEEEIEVPQVVLEWEGKEVQLSWTEQHILCEQHTSCFTVQPQQGLLSQWF